jgi:hypothetical protein
MTLTAEHCAMLMPFADALGLSHHEILSLAGKDSVARGPFELIDINSTRFAVHYQTIPGFFSDPLDIVTNAQLLRQFLPII